MVRWIHVPFESTPSVQFPSAQRRPAQNFAPTPLVVPSPPDGTRVAVRHRPASRRTAHKKEAARHGRRATGRRATFPLPLSPLSPLSLPAPNPQMALWHCVPATPLSFLPDCPHWTIRLSDPLTASVHHICNRQHSAPTYLRRRAQPKAPSAPQLCPAPAPSLLFLL